MIEQSPTIERTPNSHLESIERHPAYAQIGASRVQGRAYLYGSDFTHQNYVIIHISASEMSRGLSNDWPHTREEYIEVALSEAQWATFVSSLNVGQGVQCTLQRRGGLRIPGLTRPTTKKDTFKREMAERLTSGQDYLKQLGRAIEENAGKKKLRDLLNQASMALGVNIGFVADQFGEHVETVMERAKTEVYAYAQNFLARMGLKAIADDQSPIAIDTKELNP